MFSSIRQAREGPYLKYDATSHLKFESIAYDHLSDIFRFSSFFDDSSIDKLITEQKATNNNVLIKLALYLNFDSIKVYDKYPNMMLRNILNKETYIGISSMK
jgi:hypothetical protein